MQLNEDEAGPYQAIPQPGASWQFQGHPALQPHEYERGGTAKLLTLFRPATGQLRAKGVVSATNAVLHPWLKEQLSEILAEIEQAQPRETLPPEAERPLCARWETWLGYRPRSCEPSLRIVLVLDNLAGHLSYDLVRWFFDPGGDAPLHAAWRLVAQHGRVGAAHHRPTGTRRPASQGCTTGDRVVGADCSRVEPEADPFHLEWQAQTTARTRSSATFGRLWCDFPQRKLIAS